MTSAAILEIQGIAKTFGGVSAVDHVNLSIGRGKITGIIGPNGAGKTTLFNIASGSLLPDDGQVLFETRDITRLPPHLRYDLGIVRTFQIPREFGRLTTLENLMVMSPAQSGERIWMNWLTPQRSREDENRTFDKASETLDFLGLSGVADQPAATLSGGQKKLLELGRAIMCDPQLVLLDEPGAGVNPSFMAKIADLIRTLNSEKGLTFCVIEHDMNLIAALCDHVIVMNAGQVLTEGKMDSIRQDKRVIDAYFGGADAG